MKPMERERTSILTTIDGEEIERIYSKELLPVPFAEWEQLSEEERMLCKPYAFDQRTYKVDQGVICKQDVGVEMRDGTTIYCDIFLPEDAGEKIPAIIAWSNYGKRPNEFRDPKDVGFTPGVPEGTVSKCAKFEAVDPLYWCPNKYAVINVDPRGIGYSEGYHDQFCVEEARDGYDVIEWAAQQPWCNGKVTMAGTSALSITQWQIAAQQPPHLACIAPWEGMNDMYRESLYEGGIPCIKFTAFATAGACGLKGIDDQAAMALRYPLMNAYWENKIPDFTKITVPAYVTAGWNHFHLRGSVNGFRKISSKKKWLRAHREFEWPDFYSSKSLEELKMFFDRYCKNIHNGWELTPRVRVDVMDAYDEDYAVERPEQDFPLARTDYRKLYLDAASRGLSSENPLTHSSVSYDPNKGLAEFDHVFNKDTEITGYMKLRAYVEAEGHNDMDLFVTIKKIHENGTEIPVTIFNGTAPHPGAWGKMRVSHRELDDALSSDFQPVQSHRREQKLDPSEVVAIDVEINPTSRIWRKGEILRVQVAGRYIRDEHWIEPLMWEVDNRGSHIIHTGGEYASYLQIPVVGAKYDRSKPFVVDEELHPSHPLF